MNSLNCWTLMQATKSQHVIFSGCSMENMSVFSQCEKLSKLKLTAVTIWPFHASCACLAGEIAKLACRVCQRHQSQSASEHFKTDVTDKTELLANAGSSEILTVFDSKQF